MKILLATDGSEYSIEAARTCGSMIGVDQDTTVRVISVVEPIIPIDPFGASDNYYVEATKAAEEAAESAITDCARVIREVLGDRKCVVETKTITGNPKEEIVCEAENWPADLIVVGSHGRGFWGRILLGSVSDTIVKHAPCSVLIVRKDERK